MTVSPRFVRGASLAAVAVLASAGLACSQSRTASTHKAHERVVELDPDRTIATIGDEKITVAKLDEGISNLLEDALRDYAQRVYEVRKGALNEMVLDRIIAIEAESRGIATDQLIHDEVMDKVTPPEPDEMIAYFNRYLAGRTEASYEELEPRIRGQLTQERVNSAGEAFIDGLKAKYKVTMNLPMPELPRVNVAAVGPAKGPKDAKVTIVEFSDFECPFCSRAGDTVAQVMEHYGDQVRLVFRNFPLSFHQKAPKAAEAALCAEDQGKFWEMHDRLFAHQEAIDLPDLKAHARTIGLDGALFDACLDEGRKTAQVQADIEAATEAGVSGTPAFFINGRLLSGAQPFEAFKAVIDNELQN